LAVKLGEAKRTGTVERGGILSNGSWQCPPYTHS